MPLDTDQQQLVLDNLPLAFHLARRYHRRLNISVPLDDLRGVAALALCNASLHYDPAQGKFPGYATVAIKRAIFGAIDRERRLPRQAAELDEGTIEVLVPCYCPGPQEQVEDGDEARAREDRIEKLKEMAGALWPQLWECRVDRKHKNIPAAIRHLERRARAVLS